MNDCINIVTLDNFCQEKSVIYFQPGLFIRFILLKNRNFVNLRELGVLLSGLRVKPDPATNQPDFHAEFAKADAEIANKKQMYVYRMEISHA